MSKILCFLGFHKYIDDQRRILQLDASGHPYGSTISVTWCKHCHKCKDLAKEIAKTMAVGV